MLKVMDEITEHRLTVRQLFETYDYFTDVLEGKYPRIMLIDGKDAYKGFYRLSKMYPATRELDEETRSFFCFAVYTAKRIKIYDEEKDEPVWSVREFKKGKEHLLREYEYEREHFPSKFTIRKLSDPTRDDYGYSIQNPIEVLSVRSEYQYLNALETADGKVIVQKNRVSTHEGEGDVLIDGFAIYVAGVLRKKKIATLYLNGYGSENSDVAPKGFRFKT